ncbi:MAG: CarD family transcriptional regulator, partial [Clostridiales bacterium]
PTDVIARERAALLLQQETTRVLPALHGEERKQLQIFSGQLNEYLQQGIWDSALELLLSFFYEEAAGILDYIDEGLIIIDEPDQVQMEAEQQNEERHNRYSDLLESGRLLPSFYDNFQSFSQLRQCLQGLPLLLMGKLNIGVNSFTPLVNQELLARELPVYAGSPAIFAADMRHFRSSGMQTLISVSSEMRKKRVEEILREYELPPVKLITAGFTKGFESAELKLVLITEKDLFAREGKTRQRRTYKGGEKIANFLDLRVGDYVVHLTQGIGRYMGAERLTIDDIVRDYLMIHYAGGDKLYLPVDQLDLIQK